MSAVPGASDAIADHPLLLRGRDGYDGADVLVAQALNLAARGCQLSIGGEGETEAYGGPKAPCRTLASLWQTPQAWTLIRISPSLTSSMGISLIWSGSLALVTTAALKVFGSEGAISFLNAGAVAWSFSEVDVDDVVSDAVVVEGWLVCLDLRKLILRAIAFNGPSEVYEAREVGRFTYCSKEHRPLIPCSLASSLSLEQHQTSPISEDPKPLIVADKVSSTLIAIDSRSRRISPRCI